MENKDMDISIAESYINRLVEAIQSVTKIEEEMREFSDRLSSVDKRKATLDHYLELEGVKYAGAKSLTDEMREVMQLRRNIKQVYEVMKSYETHRGKLINPANREMLVSEIKRKQKELFNLKYRYSEEHYTKEELDILTKKIKKEDIITKEV